MYNRFIPQPDGTYQKRRMQDRYTPPPPPKQKHEPPMECQPSPTNSETCSPAPQPSCKRQTAPKTDSITGFLKQLLPKDMDTADLLVIILLLLMAGDCEEDKNNTLLTLALYFLL